MKKTISILITVLLLVTIFTGCHKDNPNEYIEPTIKNSSASDMNCFETYDNITISSLTEKGLNKKNLVIPENFETAEFNIFFDNDDFSNNTLESISFENPNFVIPADFFCQCYALKEVEIPLNTKTIKYDTFYYCKSLSEINIPEKVENIEKRAFYECTSLSEVKFNSNLTTIGDEVFRHTALKDVELPDSLTSIGESAFADIPTLKTVMIPEGVTSISHNAFYYSESDYGERDKPKISVAAGSWADIHFDEYTNGGLYAEKVVR